MVSRNAAAIVGIAGGRSTASSKGSGRDSSSQRSIHRDEQPSDRIGSRETNPITAGSRDLTRTSEECPLRPRGVAPRGKSRYSDVHVSHIDTSAATTRQTRIPYIIVHVVFSYHIPYLICFRVRPSSAEGSLDRPSRWDATDRLLTDRCSRLGRRSRPRWHDERVRRAEYKYGIGPVDLLGWTRDRR